MSESALLGLAAAVAISACATVPPGPRMVLALAGCPDATKS
jgi:hypothetical protein